MKALVTLWVQVLWLNNFNNYNYFAIKKEILQEAVLIGDCTIPFKLCLIWKELRKNIYENMHTVAFR